MTSNETIKHAIMQKWGSHSAHSHAKQIYPNKSGCKQKHKYIHVSTNIDKHEQIYANTNIYMHIYIYIYIIMSKYTQI